MPRMFTGLDGRTKVFPDGTSDEVVSRVLGVPAGELRQYGVGDSAKVAVREHLRAMPARKQNAAIAAAPSVGGLIGGVRAGVPGATIGGMAGEAVRQTANNPAVAAGVQAMGPAGVALGSMLDAIGVPEATPHSIPEAVSGVLREGATQGGLQTAGNVIAGGSKMLAQPVMAAALKFTPEVAQTAIREGISAGSAGVKKLLKKLGEYGGRTMTMVRQNRMQFEPADIINGAGRALLAEVGGNETHFAPEILETYKRLAKNFVETHSVEGPTTVTPAGMEFVSGVKGPARIRLTEAERNYEPGPTKPLTAARLQKFKQDAQAIAEPIFDRIGTLNPPSPTESAVAKWYKAMADEAQKVLENTTPPMLDPATGKLMTLAESNAQTGELIALKKVIAPDARKDVGIGAKMVSAATSPLARTVAGASAGAAVPGNRVKHAAVGAALGNPTSLSLLALGLANPRILTLLKNIPQLGKLVFDTTE